MNIFEFHQGDSPLLISAPHAGSYIPDDISCHMTKVGKESVDSDWHIHKLYDFAKEMGVSILNATHSRYVVDLNRPHDDQNLYPGQDTTGLSPIDSFAKDHLYAADQFLPNNEEIQRRVDLYWRPYHNKLTSTLTAIKEKYGYALLWDAHSIRSQVPRFFDGQLPDMNFGTADDTSCDNLLANKLKEVANAHKDFSHVFNGRFKGGHITRHYGDPENNIHAVQLEQSQITYMNEDAPFNLIQDKVDACTPYLKDLISAMLDFKPTN
ncbi:N-formylglutamate deformylase [Curvivirga aplysinae]|uniref:N-formylglutamate deformylase n=1 Tax=Curvivirga aplysinae TaxID=2529852 RepID=UPI0012BC4DC1|nr:N-formylglutamate deformylase [Curvivirga aplysinae]MTI09074.1 N-formylglutamate deformylase [Curvivirga aplysinae]